MNQQESRDILNLARAAVHEGMIDEFSNRLKTKKFMTPYDQNGVHICYIDLSDHTGRICSHVVVSSGEIEMNQKQVVKMLQHKGRNAGGEMITLILREFEFSRGTREKWWFKFHSWVEYWWAGTRRVK